MNLWRKFTNVIVGKVLLLAKGAIIKVTNTDGSITEIDLTELAAINSIGAADLAKIDGITNGTGAAAKALVLDSSADITAGLHNLTATGGLAGWGATVSTAQVAALTTMSTVALTTTGLASLSTDQAQALTTTQLTALCANNDLSAAALSTLSANQAKIISALQKIGVAP